MITLQVLLVKVDRVAVVLVVELQMVQLLQLILVVVVVRAATIIRVTLPAALVVRALSSSAT